MAVRVDDSKNIIVVTFAGKLVGEAKGATTKEVNSAISRTKIKNVVFHLDNCLSAEESVLFEMAEIVRSVAKIEGVTRLVGVNDQIYRKLKDTSLDRILLMRSNLKSATVDMGYSLTDAELEQLDKLIEEHANEMKKELAKDEVISKETEEQRQQRQEKETEKKKQIDVQFINHFLGSTTKVLETQFGIPCKPVKPFQKKADDTLVLGQVCGLISIDSKYFKGTLSISFPGDVFLALVQSVLDEDETEINEENVDLVSELANMILGDAKSRLVKEGYKVKSALPHVFWNKGNHVAKQGESLCIVIPYETPVGTFHTEVMDGLDVMTIMGRAKAA